MKISYLSAMAGITSTFSRDGHGMAVKAKGGRSSIVYFFRSRIK